MIASHNPQVDRDAGVFAYSGWRILHGELPLRDIWDHKPPGIYLLDALAVLVGGPTHAALAYLDIAIGVAVAAAAFWALRSVSRPGVALVGSVWAVLLAYKADRYAGMNFTEYPAVALALVSLGAGVRCLTSELRLRWAVMAGAASGLAAVFKPVAAGPAAALAIVLFGCALFQFAQRSDQGHRAGCRTGRVMAVVVATTALPMLLVCAWYVLAGGWDALVDTNFTYNRLYAPPLTLLVALRGMLDTPAKAGVAIPIVLLGLSWLRPMKDLDRVVHSFVTLALLFEIVAIMVQGRDYAHYYVLTVGSGSMALALGLERLLVSRRPAQAIEWGAAVIGVVILLVVVARPVQPHLSLHNVARVARADFPQLPIVDAVRSLCGPDDSVYTWGAETQVNFLAERRSPSRYVYLYPLQMPGFDVERRARELLADLQADPPCAIVAPIGTNPLIPPLQPGPRAEWRPIALHERGAYSQAPFDDVLRWIDTNYVPSNVTPGWDVLVANHIGTRSPDG